MIRQFLVLCRVNFACCSYCYHCWFKDACCNGSVQFSCSVVSDALQPQDCSMAGFSLPSPAPRACSNSCPSSQWFLPAISSSLSPSPPAFNLAQPQSLFQWVSSSYQVAEVLELQLHLASVFPMNIQCWFPLGFTDLISLQSEGLSRVFSNTTVQEHQFFGPQLSL